MRQTPRSRDWRRVGAAGDLRQCDRNTVGAQGAEHDHGQRLASLDRYAQRIAQPNRRVTLAVDRSDQGAVVCAAAGDDDLVNVVLRNRLADALGHRNDCTGRKIVGRKLNLVLSHPIARLIFRAE